MPADIPRKNKDAYVHYEFVCVQCKCCGIESNPFVYKDHLSGDETIDYVIQITGWTVDKMDIDELTVGSFVNSGENYDRGGMICPLCNENKLKEVV